MRHIFLMIIISLFTIYLFSQDKNYVFQNFSREYYQVDPYTTYNYFTDLPSSIQKILIDFQNQRYGAYQNNIVFHSGYLYDLELLEKTRPEVLSNNRQNLLVIPKYDLKFIFKNEQLGISQYWVNIKLDKYGQVLSCNFPEIVRRDLGIISIDRVKKITDSLLLETELYLKEAPIKADLVYDKINRILTWQLCYLKSSGQDNMDYLCFILDAHDNSLIRKEGMLEIRVTPCCPDSGAQEVHIELQEK